MSSNPETIPVHDAAAQPMLKPSDIVEPTRVDEARQQGSTQPGDGSEVRTAPQPEQKVVEIPGEPVPWKEQVIAYAKKTRGSVLRKSSLREHGDQILAGEANAREPTHNASKDST